MAMGKQSQKRSKTGLRSRVVVVTGASRGVGRAIAAVLGEHGATVYVTGRSVHGQPTTDGLPGTIDGTADEMTRRGGKRCGARDHSDERDVEALVRAEQGRLDILVNNAWDGYEGTRPMPAFFWQAPLRLWDAMFERGLKTHLVATYFAAPLMIESAAPCGGRDRWRGFIVSWDHDKYIGNFNDLAKHSIVRLLWGLAVELRGHNIATVALAPGLHAHGESDVARQRRD